MYQVIEIVKSMITKHCILFCPHCETYTNHVLAKSREFYSCSCGDIVWIDFLDDEETEQ